MNRRSTLLCLCAITTFLTVVAAGTLRAQGGGQSRTTRKGSALIYGGQHAFTLRSPQGWVLDTHNGAAQSLQAVFYPKGESWASSPVVMYCQVIARDSTIPDRNAQITADVSRHRNSSPQASIVDFDAMPLSRGGEGLVKRFAGKANGGVDQVVYIEERTVVVVLVLSASSAAYIDESVSEFEELVDSYTFLGDDNENILRALEAVE